MEIIPLNKVEYVEREFQQRFGLSAQVFWKNKDVWQETNDKDDLTLKELKEMARNSTDEQILEEYEKGFEENHINHQTLFNSCKYGN